MNAGIRARLQQTLGATYEIERELAGGGMSRVFVAEERSLGRRVVIKVLPSELAPTVSIDRFRREIQFAARLQHPHIVPLLAAGEADGVPYFTMPFVEGNTLRSRLAGGELPMHDAVRILRDVASALEYAHAHGIVHRDIKPDNVLLSGGSPVVTDFGVAKALSAATQANREVAPTTSLGIALGTPAYMSPEQAAAEPNVDHRTDVYAFGCLAYELLTGQAPFAGRSVSATLAAQLTENPEHVSRRRATISPPLAQLVMRCLEKSPADRPQSAGEIVQTLDGLATSSGGFAVANQGRTWRLTSLIAAVVALALVGAYIAGVSRRASSAGGKSIAVLPFVNVGADTANQFFADGMTDDLASALGKIEGLRVAARSSAYTFKGKTIDAKEVGAKLNVASLVEGTVRRAGGRLKVTAELVNTSDGLTVWSDSYERDAKDLFAVQDEITRSIIGALRLTLGAAASSAVAKHGTENLQAHELYVLGRYFANRYTESDLKKSIGLYQEALVADPRYAHALAGIADSWVNLADAWLAPHDAYPKAKAAAQRALELDPSSAEAHSAMGTVYFFYEWNGTAAESAYRQALVLNRNYARAHSYLAWLLFFRHIDSSMAGFRRAAEIDPLAPRYSAIQAQLLVTANRPDEAMVAARSALSMDPEFPPALTAVGDAAMLRRDFVAARNAYERAAAGGDLFARARQGEALAASGRTAEARAVAERLASERRQAYVDAEIIAAIHARLGDADRAFAWLDSAFTDRSGSLALLTRDQRWDPMRADPRFDALMKRINFR